MFRNRLQMMHLMAGPEAERAAGRHSAGPFGNAAITVRQGLHQEFDELGGQGARSRAQDLRDRSVIYAAEGSRVVLDDRENPRDCRSRETGKIAWPMVKL